MENENYLRTKIASANLAALLSDASNLVLINNALGINNEAPEALGMNTMDALAAMAVDGADALMRRLNREPIN